MNQNKLLAVSGKLDTIPAGRVTWVDTLKFLGIFAIYLGHYGESTARFYLFVWMYHVALFFFMSGFFALKSRDQSILSFAYKKFRTILLPWLLFCLINVVFQAVQQTSSLGDIKKWIIQVVRGSIRNQTDIGAALWFLPALFVTSVGFHILLRLTKNKYAAIAVCIVLHVVSVIVMGMPDNPSWVFNIDSAMYYSVFYALGILIFPFLRTYSFPESSHVKNGAVIAVGAIGFAYAGFTYLGPQTAQWSFVHSNDGFVFVATVLMLIPNIVLARWLSNFGLLSKIGQNTLILCGTETLLKTLVPDILGLFGLTATLSDPMSVVLYVGFLIVLSYFTLIPLLKKAFPSILQNIG